MKIITNDHLLAGSNTCMVSSLDCNKLFSKYELYSQCVKLYLHNRLSS